MAAESITEKTKEKDWWKFGFPGPVLGSLVASGFYAFSKTLEHETVNPERNLASHSNTTADATQMGTVESGPALARFSRSPLGSPSTNPLSRCTPSHTSPLTMPDSDRKFSLCADGLNSEAGRYSSEGDDNSRRDKATTFDSLIYDAARSHARFQTLHEQWTTSCDNLSGFALRRQGVRRTQGATVFIDTARAYSQQLLHLEVKYLEGLIHEHGGWDMEDGRCQDMTGGLSTGEAARTPAWLRRLGIGSERVSLGDTYRVASLAQQARYRGLKFWYKIRRDDSAAEKLIWLKLFTQLDNVSGPPHPGLCVLKQKVKTKIILAEHRLRTLSSEPQAVVSRGTDTPGVELNKASEDGEVRP
ncbi:Uu.00g078040.m01.CDS01 [Anthostomella pinea]|uniref:Uu.00g078040.m01.CDS01 n=1 Tax=Anthostomella pinea TaxID=933095 RepID=A0AAI8YJ79_9PEZI|nr:Uu.00g078040.m01.CDS01 [Anthostomella pinea]